MASIRHASAEQHNSSANAAFAAMPDISIIIVSYNTRVLTLECIKSIYDKHLGHSFEVVVIDNASNDGSANAISNAFPEVDIIGLKENIGFARANNLAVKHATGRYILLLNPDTLIVDHAIDRLLQFANATPQAKIWGGRTLYKDRTLNPTSCWRRLTLWSLLCQAVGLTTVFPNSALFNSEAYGGWMRDSIRQVDIVTGCFFLIRKETWTELGGFDADYFMYAEEADLCHRARLAGARPTFTPDACLVHYGGASETVRGDKLVRLFAGKMTFVRKHWSAPRQICAQLLFMLMCFVRISGYSLGALVFGRSMKKSASEWKTVWRRRREWVGGYPTAAK